MAKVIQCPSCGANIPENMVYEDHEFIVCPYCRTVYDWKSQRDNVEVIAVEKPKDFIVKRRKDSLEIQFPLLTVLQKLQLLVGTLVIDVFAAGFILTLLRPGQIEQGGEASVLLCGFFAALLAPIVTFLTLVAFINIAQVTADQKTVQYLYGPIPLPGGKKRFSASEISQAFVRDEFYSRKKHSYFIYTVWIILANKKREILIPRLRNPDHALYIAQELESFLQLKPAVVRGAYKQL